MVGYLFQKYFLIHSICSIKILIYSMNHLICSIKNFDIFNESFKNFDIIYSMNHLICSIKILIRSIKI